MNKKRSELSLSVIKYDCRCELSSVGKDNA